MTDTAIAVFVKTPGLSAVKTRLAKDLGRTAAEQFYRLSLKAMEATLVQAESCLPANIYWAVGEPEALCHPLWQQFKTLYTGPGDLGDRQHRIYTALLGSYRQVVLIGADSPQLASAQLQQTLNSLEKMIMPWVRQKMAATTCSLAESQWVLNIWRSVTYSCSDTSQQLLSKLTSPTAIIDRLWDVDRADDLAGLKQQLMALPQLSDEQGLILQWIERTI